MKIQDLIKDKYKTLTKSEKKIASYILMYPNDLVYGTMSDIKNNIHVGDATIIRFCQKLGFSGFSDLKIEIAKDEYLENEMKEDIYFDKNEKKIVDMLHATKMKLDQNLLEQASQLLSTSSSIYIFGVGLSGNTANDLEAMFLRIGVQVKAITDTHFQLQTASLLKSTDIVIAISLSGKTKDLYESIQVAKEHETKIITLTNYLLSPIAQLSDIVLQTIAEEFFNGGSLSGKISQLFLCELLVKTYEKHHEESSLVSRESITRTVMHRSID
ncbi:MurR/RpiR family transcriptional regulator [Lactococcus lactis]